MSRRIVYFIHSLREAGTTVQAINYCNAAAARGYDVTLISAFDGGAFADADTIKCNHTSLGKPRKLDALFGIYRLLKFIRHNKPDVMISGAKRVNLWAIIANIISRNKTRLIVTLTNDLEQKTRKRPKGRRLEALILRKIYQLADMCLVLTPAMRTALVQKGYPKHKLSLAPPPIDLIKVRERSDTIINHPWLTEKKESRKIPVIVTAGRVSEQKNYPLLLKAFAKACETKDLRLIALGTGKAKKMREIESLCASLNVSDNVDFIGFNSNPYPYIKQANLFALASNWEGFGIVLLEALSCGTTIVSTDCPTGPHDTLEGGKFGYLSPTEDVDGFSASILNALKSPIPVQDLIKRSEDYNLKTTMSYYDWAINKVLGEVSTATKVLSLQANQKLSETMAAD